MSIDNLGTQNVTLPIELYACVPKPTYPRKSVNVGISTLRPFTPFRFKILLNSGEISEWNSVMGSVATHEKTFWLLAFLPANRWLFTYILALPLASRSSELEQKLTSPCHSNSRS